MQVCNYCGRYLKQKYDNCPACGSKDFKTIQNYGEIRIDTPPKDGYKVNLENYYYKKKSNRTITLVGLYSILCVLVIGIPMIVIPIKMFGETENNSFETAFLLFFVGFIVIAIISFMKSSSKIFKESNKMNSNTKKDIKKVEYLSKHGVLIKNLKYTIKPIKEQINGNKTVYNIEVIYEIEKGKTKNFISEPKYLSALGRDDGTVDLLIDPKDTDNYFIDFEIY